MDSSWHFDWDGMSFLLDPWLIGSEIDGARWLNEQWHQTAPVAIDNLPAYSLIVITQSYEDHCHLKTLNQLDEKRAILATSKAFKKLRKNFPHRQNIHIPDMSRGQCMYYNKLGFWAIRPNKVFDPIYYALIIFNEQKEAIFYAPHGFALSNQELTRLKPYTFRMLITTFMSFELPGLMGGRVNPGMEQVYQLVDQLKPDVVLNTHDEDKETKGLVGKLARVNYPDYNAIRQDASLQFVYSPDYQPLRFDF
jgi:hypothetical protein